MVERGKGLETTRNKLKEELERLNHELRIELPQEIERARMLGDLSENAEYHMALQRQEYVKARIAQLTERIAALSTVNLNSIPKDKAAYGSLLTLFDLEKEEELSLQLVTHEEADIKAGRYSVQSPVGRALLGHRKGDEVVVETPGGKRTFEIIELKTIHDQ